MHRPLLLALLALLALPAAAQAAPAKISPRASAISEAGRATVEVANPNAHALRGTAKVTAGGRTIATRTVRLPKRAVAVVALRFDANALTALRAAGGKATITMRLRRTGGRTTTARRTLRLRLPSAPPAPAPGPAPAPAPAPGGGPGAPAPVAERWVGRMGTEGEFDDLELTVAGGQLQLTKPAFVPVSCFENGGAFRSAVSLDLFDALGPWTVGTDGLVAKQGISGNQLVSGGARTINYKVTGTAQEPGRLTGTLGMSFADSRLDIFTNRITFINCAGAQSFEAIPAG